MSAKNQKTDASAEASQDVMVAEDDSIITNAFIGSAAILLVLVILGGGAYGIYYLLQDDEQAVSDEPMTNARQRDLEGITVPPIRFTDVTAESGIDFVHENGATGEKLLPETMGSGVAFFDYDNDGDPDLLFVNACHWPDATPDSAPPTLKLYANDGSGSFTDVTEAAGLAVTLYGMGVAIGDYDNDGWRDVFITAVGYNRLFRNVQGTFEDVSETSGAMGDSNSWSSSAGFLDFDNDGDLDLFVANYIRWSREIDEAIGSTLDGVNRAYGPPVQFQGSFAYLYRNEGMGKFTDVSEEMGIHVANINTGVPVAKSLGVSIIDFDQDGWLDVIVANDTVRNMLFRNLGGTGFQEQGSLMGIGVGTDGQARGAMGIDSAYVRDSTSLGIAIGNFANEPASLYMSARPGEPFSDEEKSSGLGTQTRMELTFGLFFLDCDLDGRLEVFTANGHLEEEISKIQTQMRYEQSPHLLWNAGPTAETEFVTVSETIIGEEFTAPMVARGAAYADIDNDGDLDIVIVGCGQPARLLRNDQEIGNHYLNVKVGGPNGNPDGIGARVELTRGDQVLVRVCQPTRSYLSQCDPTVCFGLGTSETVDRIKVIWPDGNTRVLEDIAADQTISISYDAEPESENVSHDD